MSTGVGQIDLSRQAAVGLPRVLPIEGGGTARADGRAAGLVLRAINDSGVSLAAGQLVVIRSASTLGGQNPKVKGPSAPTDFAIGLTVAGCGNNEPVDILTLGLHATALSTGSISPGDLLFPSSTLGYVTATRASGAIPVGYAITAASGTSTVVMWFDPTPAGFALEHRRTLGAPGVMRHVDLLESTPMAYWSFTPNSSEAEVDGNAMNDRDTTTWTSIFGTTAPVVIDVGQGHDYRFKTIGARMLIARGGGSTPGVAQISGSNDGSTWTVILSSSVAFSTSHASPADNLLTWPVGTAYRYFKFEITSSLSASYWVHGYELYEAIGESIYVPHPSGGQALLDTVLAAIAFPGAAAGGDLSGTYPNPTVAKILGIALSGTPPTIGQVLRALSSSTAAWSNDDQVNGVTVSGAPGVGMVLTATSPTAAGWQNPSSALRPLMVKDTDGTHWNVLTDGDGNAIMAP